MNEVKDEHSESKVSKERFSVTGFIDRNIRYIQYVVYGVGISGIILIAKAIRLTEKFESVNDIPNEFFEKRVKLFGKVGTLRVDEKNCLTLGFNHTPIVSLKRKSHVETGQNNSMSTTDDGQSANKEDRRLIQITVPGMEIEKQFVPQIQEEIYHKTVKIILLSKCAESNQVHAYVGCKLRKFLPFYSDLGKWCVQSGFGKVNSLDLYKFQLTSHFYSSSTAEKYYTELSDKQKKAQRKRLGMWKEISKNETKWNFDTWLKFTARLLSKFRKK